MLSGRKIAFAIGSAAVCVAAFLLYIASLFLFQEHREPYWSRLYLTKSEIEAIAGAAESFRKTNGSYPKNLEALVAQHGVPGQESGYLKKLPLSPWGSNFQYQIEQGSGGQSVKIWTIPDRATQNELGLSELSNETRWDMILKP